MLTKFGSCKGCYRRLMLSDEDTCWSCAIWQARLDEARRIVENMRDAAGQEEFEAACFAADTWLEAQDDTGTEGFADDDSD